MNLKYASINFLVRPSIQHSNLDLLIIVKSAPNNFKKRNIIRHTWGNQTHLRDNFVIPHNLSTRVVFICGKSDREKNLEEESDLHKDLIIANFVDVYRNLTYKCLVAFKWALTEFRGNFKYLGLFDDDIFIDMGNLGSALVGLKQRRLIKKVSGSSGFPFFHIANEMDKSNETMLIVRDISYGLYLGNVFVNSTPKRNPSKCH